MGKRYLIDTNIILDYMGNKLPNNARTALSQIIDNEINLSVINKIKLPDAVIAATALHCNYTLVTNNTKDFNSIKELEVLSPNDL